MRKVSATILIAAFILSVSATVEASAAEDFEKANQFYSAKAYDSALAVYQSVERTGVESAELHFNMGNCYFKSGDIGRAVVCYLRAKRLSPADDDIAANLSFARGFTRIQMEGVQLNPVYSLIEGMLDPVGLDTLGWISSICFVLFILFLIGRFGFGWIGVSRGVIVSAVAILAISSFATTFKYRHDYLIQRAVAVSEDCPVLSGPTPQAQTELHGAPGLVVEIIGSSGSYYNVLFENKRRGWIAKNLLELV